MSHWPREEISKEVPDWKGLPSSEEHLKVIIIQKGKCMKGELCTKTKPF